MAELEEENWRLRLRLGWLKDELDQARLPVPELPVATWRFIVSRVHPDRNENSRVSNAATRWLLELRNSKAGNGNAGHAEN